MTKLNLRLLVYIGYQYERQREVFLFGDENLWVIAYK